jgi:hypothetical protein
LRGKQTHNHTHAVTIDDHYPTNDNEDVIFADIFYLKGSTNKEPYLLTILAKTKHITVTSLGTKTSKNIITALEHILDYYNTHEWKITHVITDHEANFTATAKQLAQMKVTLIQNSPEHHSRAAERAIRTIKNLVRTTYLSLPYTLPTSLYRNLITYVTERYNILPQIDGDHRSPRQRITGLRPTYNRDVKAVFGDVVMCPVPIHLQKHDLGERGEIGIIVANQFNAHGVCGVYIPTRRSLCHRTDYKIIPINEE